jgi:hypothetical protein
MASPGKNPKLTDYTALAVMFILLLLLSPLTGFWAALDAPWFSPYLVWMACIAISWWLQRYIKKHDL